MTTPSDIITDAIQKLNIYSPGETLSAADAARALQLLSDLIDQWNDDSIQLFELDTVSASLVIGTQTYTVGPGGTVAVPARPQKVSMGPAVATVTVAGPTTTRVDSVSSLEWNSIYNTSSTPISGTPTVMSYIAGFPYGILSVLPVPSATATLAFTGYFGLVNFTSQGLTAPNVVMAPGQQIALASNLAILLHSYFAIGVVTADLMGEAQQSKTTLTLTNRLSRAMSVRNVQPQARPLQPAQ